MTAEEKAKAEARAKEIAKAQEEADKVNASRSGKGTRVQVGSTRGRATQVIKYENWDDSKPDTLPTSFAEVIDIHKARNQEGDFAEKEIVRRWILGDNDILYSEASDPVAEFVEATWPEDIQKQFRIVVRNYATATVISIEDAVALIKPGFVKAQAATK